MHKCIYICVCVCVCVCARAPAPGVRAKHAAHDLFDVDEAAPPALPDSGDDLADILALRATQGDYSIAGASSARGGGASSSSSSSSSSAASRAQRAVRCEPRAAHSLGPNRLSVRASLPLPLSQSHKLHFKGGTRNKARQKAQLKSSQQEASFEDGATVRAIQQQMNRIRKLT